MKPSVPDSSKTMLKDLVSVPKHFFTLALVSVFLLLTEIIFLTQQFDTGSQALLDSSYSIYGWLHYAGKFVRLLIACFGALLIFSIPRYQKIVIIICQYQVNPKYPLCIALNLLVFSGFYYLSYLLLIDIPSQQQMSPSLVYVFAGLWLMSGLLLIVVTLLIIARFQFWGAIIKSEAKVLLAAIFCGFLAQISSYFSTSAWISLSQWTFLLAKFVLGLCYVNIHHDITDFSLGIDDFSVVISPECSGYEGMGLIIAFLAIYLWIFRQQFKFPHVLLLLPIGIMVMWLLNVARIVILIIIGDKISPQIAVSGFHSSAGWILFVGLSVSMILIVQKVKFFNNPTQAILTQAAQAETSAKANKPMALLLPFVLLMASILLANAASSGFDWFYPLKVVLSVVVLCYYRQQYLSYLCNISGIAVLIGFAVFVIWIALVPIASEQEQNFALTLFGQDDAFAINAWLLFRFLGACITVPIVEELAFRGYVLAKLINSDIEQVPAGKFTWLSFAVSSLLFGIMHGDWLAGVLAGMAYAYAYYRRGQLMDAVTAHIITNFLLSVYVFYTGHWSLW